ncbi:hypothetical protein N7468_004078 [Penicillium chermesinum]|uniref:Uncharacterized protein n=1 Tax=Penicillium chermesinum TaxID=63820 RepID=A0A9W9P7W8_9EURO|nr:uncharacterized protein N7468_004078 [Penicillium chermesinum]KAJ5239459.1 hypothetical protein N7468_004078 [Penicillium chermesinum]
MSLWRTRCIRDRSITLLREGLDGKSAGLEYGQQEIHTDGMNLDGYYCTKYGPGKCNVFWSEPSSGVEKGKATSLAYLQMKDEYWSTTTDAMLPGRKS